MKRNGSVLLGIMLLLTGLLGVGIALSSAVSSSSIKIQKQYLKLSALAYAEAGVNKGLWKINSGDLSYASNSNGILETDISGGEYRVKITNCPGLVINCKYIESQGYIPNEAKPTATKTVRVKLMGVNSGTSLSFNYGVQVDSFGAYMEENAIIKGSVFTNGPIDLSNKALITGSAISAGTTPTQSSIGTRGTVEGNASAYTISNGTAVKGTKTSGSYPSAQLMPLTPDKINSTIDEWEAVASNNVHTGNLTTIGLNNEIGPMKIDGDWIIDNGAEVKIKGAVWVTGNITVGNSAIIYLDPIYGNNSGLVIADHKSDRNDHTKGRIVISQGASINGIDKSNPKTPSYVMFFSTQSPPTPAASNWKSWPAISIEQGSVGGVYYSPFGSLELKNNAQARALACAGLIIRQNAVVNYDSGMANSSFAAGPGGEWTITEWLIID